MRDLALVVRLVVGMVTVRFGCWPGAWVDQAKL